MLLKQFFRILSRYFSDALIFVDADYGRLFTHPLTFHFFDRNVFLEPCFFYKFFEALFNLVVVTAALFAVAKVNGLVGFFGFSHNALSRCKCIL